jgi:hypothetical protein
MSNNELDDSDVTTSPINTASDYALLKEINRLAASLSYFDVQAPGSIKNVEFMPSYIDGVWVPDTTHLDTHRLPRNRLIANHPQRFLRKPKAIELEVDALIALQRAAIALEDHGDRIQAEKKLKRARKLIVQAIDAENAAEPAPLAARQQAGRRVAAAKRIPRKAAIDQYVAGAIRHMPLTSKHLASHPALAEALKAPLARHLYDQRDVLGLSYSVLDKVRVEIRIVDGVKTIEPTEDAEKYAYGQIRQLLAKPKVGKAPSQARRAYAEKVGAPAAGDPPGSPSSAVVSAD